MIATIPQLIKVWGRGQLTIPKEIRKTLRLDDATVLSIFAVGRCLILTPKRLVRSSIAKETEHAMNTKKLTMNDLLKSLKEERQRYNRENYAG